MAAKSKGKASYIPIGTNSTSQPVQLKLSHNVAVRDSFSQIPFSDSSTKTCVAV